MSVRGVVLTALVASLLSFETVRAAVVDSYLLGAGDKLSLKIMEWRPDRGEPYEWPGFSGDYAIDANGDLLLPIIGSVPASERPLEDVAKDIGRRLQAQAGLANPLQVSAQIAQYRPIYVLGGVEKPGEYPYRPGLTVLEAVSLAGGMYRVGDAAAALARQQIEAQGALSTSISDATMLEAERARLQAEADNAPAITFSRASTPEDAAARSVQQALFASRRASLDARIQAFDEAKRLYGSEIDTLKQKIRVMGSQADLIKSELNNISALMRKGLTTEPRRIALTQDLDQIESNELEYQLSIIRAEQGAASAERDKSDAVNTRRSEALKQLAEVKTKLAQNEIARATALRLGDEAGSRLKREGDRDFARRAPPVYSVRRKGAEQAIVVMETDPIQPGDVLKVDDAQPLSASN